MLAERRGGSSGGADLVDEPVVERFPGVEVEPAPHVLGDLLGRPARKLGEASVEPPEQVLLLATVRGDLVWRPGELPRRLEEPKPGVRGGRAVVSGRRDTDGGTTNLSAAMCEVCRVEEFDCVDDDEGWLERAVRAVQ